MAAVMDHCTLWPEGWWSHCCAVHDADYSAQAGRLVADVRLLQCVAESLPDVAMSNPVMVGAALMASATVSAVMFIGVRLFGRRFYRK
jgi:hypothetical protein